MGWQDIPGQGDDILVFHKWLATVLPQGASFVEVGVFLGRSLAHLGTLRPDLGLYAVDAWEMQEAHEHTWYRDKYGPTMWEAFNSGMRAHAPGVLARLHVARGSSRAPTIAADCAFIDAGHDYPDISADIAHWRPQVRPGGYLCGHDFGHVDVRRAVREVCGQPDMGPDTPGCFWTDEIGKPYRSTCWWVQVPR